MGFCKLTRPSDFDQHMHHARGGHADGRLSQHILPAGEAKMALSPRASVHEYRCRENQFEGLILAALAMAVQREMSDEIILESSSEVFAEGST